MALEIDPIYHTETMVRILREQGSSLYAMELAEKILEKNPGHESVRQLLEEMKEEARASFERFRQAGRVEESSDEVELDAESNEAPVPEIAEPVVVSETIVAAKADVESIAREGEQNAQTDLNTETDLPDNVVSLHNVAPPPETTQVRLLKQLLNRVQEYRKVHGH